jgi:uncharacterized protein YbcI
MSGPSALHPTPDGEQSAHGSTTMAAISRRIVALVKEYYGKGPTRARTYHMGDLVVVLLSGGYTPVERTLIEDGRSQAVMDQRAAFQEAMRPRFKRVIEEEMRRGVLAFMSTMHHDPDLNAELFVLEPAELDRPDGASTTRSGGGAVAEGERVQ